LRLITGAGWDELFLFHLRLLHGMRILSLFTHRENFEGPLFSRRINVRWTLSDGVVKRHLTVPEIFGLPSSSRKSMPKRFAASVGTEHTKNLCLNFSPPKPNETVLRYLTARFSQSHRRALMEYLSLYYSILLITVSTRWFLCLLQDISLYHLHQLL
jgi:hypothetical protein